MVIQQELRKIIAMKKGNKDLALFYFAYDNSWSFHLGNENPHVMLGEINGEFEVNGNSIEDVIVKMEKKLAEKGEG